MFYGIKRELRKGLVFGLLASTCKENAAVKLNDSLYDWLWCEGHDVIEGKMKQQKFFKHFLMAIKAQAEVDSKNEVA